MLVLCVMSDNCSFELKVLIVMLNGSLVVLSVWFSVECILQLFWFSIYGKFDSVLSDSGLFGSGKLCVVMSIVGCVVSSVVVSVLGSVVFVGIIMVVMLSVLCLMFCISVGDQLVVMCSVRCGNVLCSWLIGCFSVSLDRNGGMLMCSLFDGLLFGVFVVISLLIVLSMLCVSVQMLCLVVVGFSGLFCCLSSGMLSSVLRFCMCCVRFGCVRWSFVAVVIIDLLLMIVMNVWRLCVFKINLYNYVRYILIVV